jgi:GDPmannose 4,6-dehydratase
MNKTAIITGVNGQTGSYMAEYLIEQGYTVVGIYRRISTGNNFGNIASIFNHARFNLIAGDICDYPFMFRLIQETLADEFYNYAAMSHVGQSFSEPTQTFRIDAEAVIAQLDAIRKFSPHTKYLQASTSELFGTHPCPEEGYDESTPFRPRSPYGVAKLAAHHAVRNYREAYGVYACNSICHNHESPRRGLDFAPRKITNGVARIKMGRQEHLHMGNLEAVRDIGHAKDYVTAQHMMLQQEKPDDYLVATGEAISIREMLEYVCSLADLSIDDVYVVDPRFMRPSDVPFLKGNAAKMKSLGWEPEYDWKRLLKEMYEHDLWLLNGKD